MPLNVQFSDDMITLQEELAPSFEFSKYAQTAVREKLDRDRIVRNALLGAAEEANGLKGGQHGARERRK